jgi:hypothetical protein
MLQLQRKESVPFLRRRSTEIELRRELKRSLSAGPGHRSAGTSERGADDDSEMLVVPVGIDIPGREQQPAYPQAMSLPSSMTAPSFLMAADDLIPRAHTFVKSTFSKRASRQGLPRSIATLTLPPTRPSSSCALPRLPRTR